MGVRARQGRNRGYFYESILELPKIQVTLKLSNILNGLNFMEIENTETNEPESSPLTLARDEFITQWGVIGSAWGINRTMAQIHALLMVSQGALCTDDIMKELSISRGNAHSNLRELVSWGVIKSVLKKGERKEFFACEKDVWKMFCIITRERKRREIDPVLDVLKTCIESTTEQEDPETEAFRAQLNDLTEVVETVSKAMEKISNSEASKVIPWALKNLT
jgi:DNA-binding transcriptional regulator GbsR (MarR family)